MIDVKLDLDKHLVLVNLVFLQIVIYVLMIIIDVNLVHLPLEFFICFIHVKLVQDSNCLICSTDNNKCVSCASGFGFDIDLPILGTCLPCQIQYCTNCYDRSYCSDCQAGFTLVDGSCRNCLPITNCVQCTMPSSGICNSCSSGYGIGLMGCY